jgi:hypothetical protein
MQGIGRLRMLDRTQSLILVGSDDVTSQICQVNSITRDLISPRAVIQWVIENTLHDIRDGLVEWGLQGAHYCYTDRENDRIAIVEDFSCKEYYSGVNQHSSLVKFFQAEVKFLSTLFQNPTISNDLQTLLSRIESGIANISDQRLPVCINLGEECERELEQEKEVVQEAQVQFLLQQPNQEVDWDYSSVLEWSIQDFKAQGIVSPLSDLISSSVRYDKGPQSIQWPKNIYCTKNFARPIKNSLFGLPRLNNYLRPANAILCLDTSLVLLSEREADCLLPIFWSKKSLLGNGNFRMLVNLASLEKYSHDSNPRCYQVPLSLCYGSTFPNSTLDEICILALQVFNGEPKYGKRRDHLPRLLHPPDSRKQNALELVSVRGNGHLIPKSDLEFFEDFK